MIQRAQVSLSWLQRWMVTNTHRTKYTRQVPPLDHTMHKHPPYSDVPVSNKKQTDCKLQRCSVGHPVVVVKNCCHRDKMYAAFYLSLHKHFIPALPSLKAMWTQTLNWWTQSLHGWHVVSSNILFTKGNIYWCHRFWDDIHCFFCTLWV